MDEAKVAHTAVYASMSKVSALRDPSNRRFKQQTPLIDRIYGLRRDVVHHLTAACAAKPMDEQLIILGAGLDSSYNSLSRDIFHVDFESVISDYDMSQAGENVHLIAADLRNTSELEDQLRKNGLRTHAGTVVLIECVLCYMEVEDVKRLLLWVNQTLPRSLLVIYNPVAPDTPAGVASFSRQMQRGFASRGSALRSAPGCPWKNNELIRECGFKHSYTATMDQIREISVPSSLTLPEESGTEPSRAFDEHYSELMLNQHYIVSVSSSCTDTFQRVVSKLPAYVPDSNNVRTSDCARSTAQMHRADVLAARIKALEMVLYSQGKMASTATATATGVSISSGLVRVVPASSARPTAHQVAELYQMCFEPYMQKYASVQKFGSKTVKELRQGRWGPGQGTTVWVATVSASHSIIVEGVSANAGDEVIGCIALKLKFDTRKADSVSVGPANGGNYVISDQKPKPDFTSAANEDGAGEAESLPVCRGRVGELSCMCVDPRYRGCGVARALISKALGSIRSGQSEGHGEVRVDLSTILDQERARGCYEAAGFRRVREETLPDGCQLVYMSAQL